MYKIVTRTGSVITDQIQYIRRHPNGCLVLTSEDKAEGVVSHSVPYLFEDGACVTDYDGGHGLTEQAEATASVEAAVCEQDMQTAQRLADIEAAICELDMIKGGN